MKSCVFPTQKGGDLTGHGETKSQLALLGGIHNLVPMLARNSTKTRRYSETHIHRGGDSSLETYMRKKKLIASLSVVCSIFFIFLSFIVDSNSMEGLLNSFDNQSSLSLLYEM